MILSYCLIFSTSHVKWHRNDADTELRMYDIAMNQHLFDALPVTYRTPCFNPTWLKPYIAFIKKLCTIFKFILVTWSTSDIFENS